MRLQPELIPGLVLPARLPAGFVLGAYVVDGWHRDGTHAAIYRAYRLTDARRVAVKLQLPSTVRDPSVGDRFEREAELLWRVRGLEHVIELLDVGVLDDGRRYLVLEWVDGEDLEARIGSPQELETPLPIALACRIAGEVARGLVALHERGVGHMDLRPASVMLRRDDEGLGQAPAQDGAAAERREEVVLVGFGSAAELREPDAPEPRRTPRRARAVVATPACDVHALGMLVFTMLAGWAPEGWPPEMLPRLDSLRPGVPPALAELVRACTSAAPRQRPASTRVVVAMLDAILGALEAGDAPEPAAGPEPAKGSRPAKGPQPVVALRTTMAGPVPMVVPRSVSAPRPMAVPRTMSALHPIVTSRTVSAAHPVAAEPRVMAGGTVVAPVPGGFVAEGPGDTMIAPVLEGVGAAESTAVAPVLEGEGAAESTAVAPVLEGVEPDDTAVLEAVPETAGSSMIEHPTEELHDTAVLEAPEASPAMHATPYAPPGEASGSELEWLARHERAWVPWVVVAGVVAVLGTTSTWLLAPSGTDEGTAVAELRPVPISSRAQVPIAPAAPASAAAAEEPEPRAAEATARAPKAEREPTPHTEREPLPSGSSPPAPSSPSSSPSSSPPAPSSHEPRASKAKRARAASPDLAGCDELRAEAETAKRTRAWRGVLQATAQRRCWGSPELRVTRARLRVAAHAELGQLERCVEEGAKHEDREIAARTALCRKKLGA